MRFENTGPPPPSRHETITITVTITIIIYAVYDLRGRVCWRSRGRGRRLRDSAAAPAGPAAAPARGLAPAAVLCRCRRRRRSPGRNGQRASRASPSSKRAGRAVVNRRPRGFSPVARARITVERGDTPISRTGT